MVKVFFHYKTLESPEWQNEERLFTRVPVVGEYVALSWSAEFHRVYAIIHCPFEGSHFDAEVYSVYSPGAHISAIDAGEPLPFDREAPAGTPISAWAKLGKSSLDYSKDQL